MEPWEIFYYFDPTTSKRQYFSIPEKIVYYAAKNATSSTMFQKLLHTCKYFFIVNPVIIVPSLICFPYGWYACNTDGKKWFQLRDSLYFKVWIQHEIDNDSGFVSRIFFPGIYKNDAKIICFGYKPCMAFDEFMCIAGNAEKLTMYGQTVKYSNGANVLLEDIIKNLPKLKFLDLCYLDVTETTASKLMEIQHFKQMSRINLKNIPETLDVGTMFDFMIENKHIKIELSYHHQISDPCKELIRECSKRLRNENGCDSTIRWFTTEHGIYVPSLYSTISLYSLSSSDGELMFPWNEENDEEWEFPWDKE